MERLGFLLCLGALLATPAIVRSASLDAVPRGPGLYDLRAGDIACDTIGGIRIEAGDTILLTGQTVIADNGIWRYERPMDFSGRRFVVYRDDELAIPASGYRC